ncbi:MAG: Hsp70 family protein [Spirochaetota bacterium]
MISLGIDFGTSNSAAAVIQNGTAVDITFDGNSFFPTCLYRRKRGGYKVGFDAIRSYMEDNVGQRSNFERRSLGRSIDMEIIPGESVATQLGIKEEAMTVSVPVHTVVDTASKGRFFKSLKTALRYPSLTQVTVFDETVAVFRLLEQFFRAIKKAAEKQMKDTAADIVIGMPVIIEQTPKLKRHYERVITVAARESGFREVSFAMEPVAAAKECSRSLSDGTALVFDFGGGTLDLSVLRIVSHDVEVLANRGLLLGGDDYDKEIQKLIHPLLGKGSFTRSIGGVHRDMPAVIFDKLLTLDGILELSHASYDTILKEIKFSCENSEAGIALYRLVKENYGYPFLRACESAKMHLSKELSAPFSCSFGESRIHRMIERHEFEHAIAESLTDIAGVIRAVLSDAHVTADDIDSVIPVGGSTQVPAVQKILADIFGEQRMKHVDLYTSISRGLAAIAQERYGVMAQGLQ